MYVGLPNASERKAILEIQRNKMPWSQDVDLSKLVEETDGANASSLIALCQAAAIQAMQRIPTNAPEDEQVRQAWLLQVLCAMISIDVVFVWLTQCIAMIDFVAALAKGTFDFQNPEP